MAIISGNPTNGNDIIVANDANDSINSLAGNDTVSGGGGNDTLKGGGGNDLIAGNKGIDTMIGGEGNDILSWADGEGSDRISGNAGTDIIGVQGSLALGENFVLNQQGTQAIFNRVNLGQFKLTVDTSEQFIVQSEGGNDSFDVNNLTNTAVELVTFSGGVGNDTLDGNDTSIQLIGNGDAGNDFLSGGSAADSLNGGEGNDFIAGNKGIDTMIGGAGSDILVWADGDASDRISGNAGTDTVGVQGSLTLEDTFVLSQQGNLAIFDRTDQGRQFKLTVDTSETFAVLGEGGNDSFDVNNLANTDVELVTFSGGAGNDTLDGTNTSIQLIGNGGAGNDVLIGGSANDILTGGAGNDTLTGGAGDDYFTFNSPNQGIDRITDFAIADDSIQVLATGFGGGLTAGALGAGQFRIGAAAADANDRFIYNDVNGNLSFDRDGAGGAAQVQLATLIGAPTLNAGGIVVI